MSSSAGLFSRSWAMLFCLGFVLGAIAMIFIPYPILADPPQENETPGLIHGVTPPPQEVDVHSLEPAPPVDETTPPRMVPPHTPDPEGLKLKKQLIEEGIIKPQTDVIEDTAVGNSSERQKDKNK